MKLGIMHLFHCERGITGRTHHEKKAGKSHYKLSLLVNVLVDIAGILFSEVAYSV
jgi:hypothetical protein